MKAHLKINNPEAGVTRRGQDSRSRADCLLNYGNIVSSMVEQAALGAEVILHVDDDHGSSGGIDRDRFGPRVELDNPAFHILSRRTRLLRSGGLFSCASNKRGGCCCPNEAEYFPSAKITGFGAFLYHVSFHGTLLRTT